MKESEFIDQNKDKWLHFERVIKQSDSNPDELSDVFIQVTDDLSHSRSNYKNRSVRVYLNDLAGMIFDKLGKRKRLSFEVIKDFYLKEIPQLMYLARKEMLISFLVFIVSMAIGIYSSIKNPQFAALVLGPDYVAMTQANIAKGEAMAVYTGGTGMEGFLRILLNNARIDVMMLGFGLVFSVGALFILIRNGIMVGVFQYFFFEHGGFKDSLLTIWLHGTIEITTIGLMGGVALLAGKGLLFPGNYTRYQSFRLSAGNAGKLLLMVLPFTFIAAVIEGFITRMTGMPDLIKGFFILLSLAIVVVYFFIYPRLVHKRIGANPIHERLSKEYKTHQIVLDEVKTAGKIIIDAFIMLRNNFGRNAIALVTIGVSYVFLVNKLFPDYMVVDESSSFYWLRNVIGLIVDQNVDGVFGYAETNQFTFFKIVFAACSGLLLFMVNLKPLGVKFKLKNSGWLFLSALPAVFAAVLVFNKQQTWYVRSALGFGVLALSVLAVSIIISRTTRYDYGNNAVALAMGKVFHLVVAWVGISMIYFFVQMIGNSGVTSLLMYVIYDLLPSGKAVKEEVSTMTGVGIFVMLSFVIVPYYFYLAYFSTHSLIEKYFAPRLKEEVSDIQFETK